MDAFELVGKLTLDSQGVESGLNAAETTGKFSSWGVTVGNLAAKAFSATFSAATKFARSIFETGMDFDAQLSGVNSIKDFTEEEFTAIREEALELGRTTKYTATEVGEAFYYMGLAGWDSEQMLAGIEPVLNLAAASGENLGRASDIVTDALTAFGYTAEDTAMFVDVLAQASANSNTTVGMMGEAFKYLAPVAGSLGYTVQDVAVAMGLLANSGIKGSQAGTSLRQILGTLENPSDKAKKAMKELGITIDDGTGKIKPFKELISELRTVLQESDYNPKEGRTIEEIAAAEERYAQALEEARAQQEAGELDNEGYLNAVLAAREELANYIHFNTEFLGKLGDIGGLRGISSLLALMMSTDEDFDQLVQSIENSEGAAAEMRDKQIDNLRGDITLLNSALDGLKILVSDKYKDDLRSFVSEFTEEIGQMSQAFNEGGLAGMFTNLTDWIIHGITDTLKDPKITVDGASDFGAALGEFVGHLVNELVTSAPDIMSGLFRAGVNLAGGIVEGLFAGLFGTGDESMTKYIQGLMTEEDEAIADATQTAIEAQGIVKYLDDLVAKYGDAASDTTEWADAMERLKSLLPDVTSVIGDQSASVGTMTSNLRDFIELTKTNAIQAARNKTLEDLRQKYIDTEVELATAQQGITDAEYTRQTAADKMIELLRGRYGELFTADSEAAYRGMMEKGEFGKFKSELYDAAERLGLSKGAVDGMMDAYRTADQTIKENASAVESLTSAAEALQSQMQIAEAAAAHAAEVLGSMTGISTGGPADGQHAIGSAYIPYDNYHAILHRGEQVLTATQARQRNSGGNVDSAAIAAAVRGAVLDLTMELNGKTVGRVFGDATAKQVSNNMRQMTRKHE